jgi:hypothetical protein
MMVPVAATKIGSEPGEYESISKDVKVITGSKHYGDTDEKYKELNDQRKIIDGE